jgi:hypothetical protein
MAGEVLWTHARLGAPPVVPLDTMLLFERADDNRGRPATHEVLSLIHEERGTHSYPWTVFASLATHHEVGDACVVCSRLHKHGPGWSAGLHSEVFNHNRAVALGVNIEMSNDYAGEEATKVIGLNILASLGPEPCDYAIHIHDNQTHFETGIGLEGAGRKGVDISGKYEVGLDMHSNDIRLAEGACIILDGEGQVRMRYNNGRVEFLNGDRCVGYIDMEGDAQWSLNGVVVSD